MKADNAAAQEELDALKADNAATKEEMDSLREGQTATQKELDSLKAEYEALQQEIARLEAELAALGGTTPPDEEPTEKIKIYIDQGHNPADYHNSGASGNGLYEGDLTYAIGILLAQTLEADGRFEVCLSRPTASTVLGTDNTSSLAARVAGAEAFGADYFISLHVNSYDLESVTGVEVFAAEKDSTSYDFGKCLLQGMVASTSLRDRTMKLNPDLYVLKNATMPAVLLEMGFISNPGDAALLSQNPELFVEGIYDGILTYFALA